MMKDVIKSFFDQVIGVTIQYRMWCKDREISDFNVFMAISDIYYRENFHSDFMARLLNPSELHHEKDLFIQEFIELVNAAFTKQGETNINPENYNPQTRVLREKGKIDILILGTKHLIIVENKINNAKDMERQLPRYVEYVKDNYEDYILDAIVYIPLDEHKTPDKSSWIKGDEEKIGRKLVIVPACSTTNDINLVDKWLMPSYDKCKDANTKPILKQYIKLVKVLNRSLMDKDDLNKLAEILMTIVTEDDNKKVSNVAIYRNLTKMWDELCKDKLNELIEIINNANINWGTFSKELNNDGSVYCRVGTIGINTKQGNQRYAIGIGTYIKEDCQDDSCFYNVQFWNSTNYDAHKYDIDVKEEIRSLFPDFDESILSSATYYEGMKCDIAWYFRLGEEDKIVDQIKYLLKLLSKA